MTQRSTHHKTIVISDIHLGSKWSKTKEVIHFLKQNSCETLILCGDIIDGWVLSRGRRKKWLQQHTDFFRQIAAMEKETKIYYIRGNHDDFIERIMPFTFQNLSIIKDFVYESFNKRYFVFHGDALDNVTAKYKWISKLGDISYNALLGLNEVYNKYRTKRGLPYYSISAKAKQRAKTSVSKLSDFNNQIKDLARINNCESVICGHTHHPLIQQMDDILYLNSGDWIESLSALTEDFDGQWHLSHWKR